MAARSKSIFEWAKEDRAAFQARNEEWPEFEEALEELAACYRELGNPVYAYEAIALCLRHTDKFAAMICECGDGADNDDEKWPSEVLDWAAEIVATGLEKLIRDGSAKGKPDLLRLLGLRKKAGQWNWLAAHRTMTNTLYTKKADRWQHTDFERRLRRSILKLLLCREATRQRSPARNRAEDSSTRISRHTSDRPKAPSGG